MDFPFISGQVETIFGLPIAELSPTGGRQILEMIHPEDQEYLNNSILSSAEKLTTFHFVGRICMNDASIKWIRAQATPERNSEGVVLWDGIMLDVTKDVEREEQLRESQIQSVHLSQLSAVGEVAAGVAHEINNPLTIIQGYAERLQRLVERQQLDPEKLADTSKKIVANTERISKIVQSLKKFTRKPDQLITENVNLVDLLNEALELCWEKFKNHGIDLRFTSSADQVIIKCIPVEVSLIAFNLLMNAYQATITLEDRWVKLHVDNQHDAVMVSVTDSGLGVPPGDVDRIWQPFYTTRANSGGTGLGLSISRRLAESQGASLTYNPASKNTQFVLKIPKSPS